MATSKRPPGASLPVGDSIHLRLPSSLDWLGVVRSAIQVFSAHLGAGWLERLELPVVEAATNAVRHAHRGDASVAFELSIRRDGDRVVAEIVDRGELFDPPPPTGEVPDLAADHGRGLFLIRNLTDGFTVDHPQGSNRAILEWLVE